MVCRDDNAPHRRHLDCARHPVFTGRLRSTSPRSTGSSKIRSRAASPASSLRDHRETPTLDDAEQILVIERVVAAAKGRVPVFAGTGSFSTKKTIAASKAALAAGADGVMVVMPYYSKPSQDGLREHVLAVARAVAGPIILYNVPSRTIADLAADTTAKICEEAANVVAIKDATGNVLRCQELKRRLGDRLTVMCGDDGLTVPMMAVGASGVISVTSNVRPRAASDVTRFARENAWDRRAPRTSRCSRSTG